ncbi:MAG: tetratricopeptide repeat protein [Opitutaceae bacterium]|nr:tetratricopeptide repeat protein [Opitutaceae bacterium]
MPRSLFSTPVVTLVLALVVGLLYGRLGQHQPIAFDDALYVTQNTWVLQGLTAKGALWAFTNADAANWHPLTWLSHMADQSAFAGHPGIQMLENAVWHLANSVLVFLVLSTFGLSRPMAAVLALVFAAHPLNVESVAWLSQRKTQLSTCFLLATVLLYLRTPPGVKSGRRAWLLVLLFSLSLMAKATGVVLPAVLFVHEFLRWRRTPETPRRVWFITTVRRLAPLGLVAGVGAVVTFLAQQGQGAVASMETLTLAHRVANAGSAIVTYLRTFAWPAELCLFYSMPAAPDWAAFLLGLLLLAIGALWAAAFLRRAPLMALGLAWFGLSLLPVIGLIQVGSQSHADRYMYLPMIGLLLFAGAWAETALRPDGIPLRPALLGLFAAFGVGMACHTAAYVPYWSNPETAYRRALAVGGSSYAITLNLAGALEDGGFYKSAETVNALAARTWPNRAGAVGNYASSLALRGKYAEAEVQYRRALALEPDNFKLHYLLGLVLIESNNPEAEVHLQAARRLLPPDSEWRSTNLEIRNILLGRARPK